MGYRDELEAAQARAEALERELADKDAEIEGLEDKLARTAELEKRERKQQKRSRRRGRWSRVTGWFSNSIVWIVLGVVVAAGVAGGVVWCISSLSQKLHGQFEAKGAPFGDWVMKVNECDSGQRRGFVGVDLKGGGVHLRLIETPAKGPLVRVSVKNNNGAVLGKAQCKVFDYRIKKTNTTVNDVRLVDGHLTLDCTTPQGGSLRGRVTFENCR